MVDRDKLSSVLEAHTPLTLATFENIHGPSQDRNAVHESYKFWKALKEVFPEARLWKIREIKP